MAHTMQPHDLSKGGAESWAVFSSLRSIAGFFRSVVVANHFARDYEAYAHMSDAELAVHGLTREEIVPFLAKRWGMTGAR